MPYDTFIGKSKFHAFVIADFQEPGPVGLGFSTGSLGDRKEEKMMKKTSNCPFNRHVIATLMLAASLPVYSGDFNTGKIKSVEVTNNENFGFRITLQNEPAMCVGGMGWAYLLNTDSNYTTYVSTLFAAKMADREVDVSASNDSVGKCRITYILVR